MGIFSLCQILFVGFILLMAVYIIMLAHGNGSRNFIFALRQIKNSFLGDANVEDRTIVTMRGIVYNTPHPADRYHGNNIRSMPLEEENIKPITKAEYVKKFILNEEVMLMICTLYYSLSNTGSFPLNVGIFYKDKIQQNYYKMKNSKILNSQPNLGLCLSASYQPPPLDLFSAFQCY